MNSILAVPLTIRLMVLAMLGAGLGVLVNWAVDRIRWQPTFLSPWNRDPAGAPRRAAPHYLPIWGWLARRGESHLHYAGFWLRPLAIELALALALPALYQYEVVRLGLLAGWHGKPAATMALVHAEYLSHVMLITLMLIASMVDLDDKIIPDAVTVPGTLLGLFLAILLPGSLLPEIAGGRVSNISLASPHAWPAILQARPQTESLLLGLVCVWVWCAGLLPRVWRIRRGWRVAAGLFFGRLRDRASAYIGLMGAVASLAALTVWYGGDLRWRSLLTALVGMAITGGFTWLVRVVAGASIGREALGFGDVTLMAMIGAFLGWQAGLIVFFLAPFFGLVSGIVQWIMHREPEIPYGPFLCLAALAIVLCWPVFWELTRPIFAQGLLIPIALAIGIALMGGMLSTWHWLLGR